MKTHSDSQNEDVASLFRKFGGDVRDYKEFAPMAEPGRPAVPWPMPVSVHPGSAANEDVPQAVAPVAPVVTSTTMAVATARDVAPPEANSEAAVPPTAASTATAVAVAPAPRELDVLFRRLAGSSSVATPAHSLMVRWRRPV